MKFLSYIGPDLFWASIFLPMFFVWMYLLNDFLHSSTSGGEVVHFASSSAASVFSSHPHVSVLTEPKDLIGGMHTVEAGEDVHILFINKHEPKVMRWEHGKGLLPIGNSIFMSLASSMNLTQEVLQDMRGRLSFSSFSTSPSGVPMFLSSLQLTDVEREEGQPAPTIQTINFVKRNQQGEGNLFSEHAVVRFFSHTSLSVDLTQPLPLIHDYLIGPEGHLFLSMIQEEGNDGQKKACALSYVVGVYPQPIPLSPSFYPVQKSLTVEEGRGAMFNMVACTHPLSMKIMLDKLYVLSEAQGLSVYQMEEEEEEGGSSGLPQLSFKLLYHSSQIKGSMLEVDIHGNLFVVKREAGGQGTHVLVFPNSVIRAETNELRELEKHATVEPSDRVNFLSEGMGDGIDKIHLGRDGFLYVTTETRLIRIKTQTKPLSLTK